MKTDTIYKALKSYEKVDINSCKCTFYCSLNKKTLVKTLPVSVKQIHSWIEGTHIQKAMENLSVDDRDLFVIGPLF